MFAGFNAGKVGGNHPLSKVMCNFIVYFIIWQEKNWENCCILAGLGNNNKQKTTSAMTYKN